MNFGLDALRARTARWEARLQELLRLRAEAVHRAYERKERADGELEDLARAWAKEWQADRRRLDADAAAVRARLDADAARRTERIDRATAAAVAPVKSAAGHRIDVLRQKEKERTELVARQMKEKYAPRYERSADFAAEIEALRAKAGALKRRIADFAESLRVPLDDRVRAEAGPVERDDVAAAAERSLAENEALVARRTREWWVRFYRSTSLPALALVDLILHGAALGAFWVVRPEWFQWGAIGAGVTFGLSLPVLYLMRRNSKMRARALVNGLQMELARTQAILRPHETQLRRSARRIGEELLEEQNALTDAIRQETEAAVEAVKEEAEGRRDALKRRRDALAGRVAARRDAERRAVEARLAEATSPERTERELARRRRERADSQSEAAGRERAELDRLAREWTKAIEEARREADEARRHNRRLHPDWSDPSWPDLILPEKFPNPIFLGDVTVDLRALAGRHGVDDGFAQPAEARVALPLHLSFPSPASLFIRTDARRRDRAIQGLFTTVLRILSTFPAAKTQFILVDPVGLGQSFSALMHLADFDEAVVGTRIWTEPAHIERKLTELTEHIEKVIQKYLRNRYATIDDYNREVGQMAEPYRFLVVADFPANFSDLALERLAAIVSSGARCGVHTLIAHDRGKRLPAGLHLAQSGLEIDVGEAGFAVAGAGPIEFESPPEPAALSAILGAIGKQCAEAGRVELAFDTAAPTPEQVWSLDSVAGVRLPLGRAGADRLQMLDLGRGTAQHALIAGKTGSGKSTLFHVMITNAALWYSPRELELYLVDYKKGVEFKTYATHRLPHARVIAIESDREFGLSVLRRLDRELAQRAEKFRAAGVQDFASYRRVGPMARTLLLIDEFQEFFVEEDAIGQEAALLLDRIVRQGRAFGVHVVLGSQTLGGSYTLARATLGQMGVRIALQCNEADSYLILSDDNAAARLLGRPGEAIYNDMGGRIEGNNPFQIVWLPDEVQARHLAAVAERTEREGWRPDESTAIFEGNVPADIRCNVPLARRLERPFDGDDRVWLGEAMAIGGLAEVRFKPQGGANLLMVGQQRDSATAVVFSALTSLAAARPPGGVRFVLLGYDGPPIPHGVEAHEVGRVAEVMEELAAEVAGRVDGGRPSEAPIFVVLFDAQKFRKLRAGDEFDLGGDEKPTPDRLFASMLADGPAVRVHTIVWCDSLNNLNRTFNRKTLREFELRVLFQMSATDSSELIDSPAAGKLGFHRGLLYIEEAGTIEKFRPYAAPEAEWVEGMRRALVRPVKT